MAIGEILAAINAFKSVFDIWDKLKEKLPESPEKEELVKKLGEAQKVAQITEANAAKELGYQTCQCTWPPQIMLSMGYGDEGSHECFRCPRCQKVWPNPSRPTRATTASYY